MMNKSHQVGQSMTPNRSSLEIAALEAAIEDGVVNNHNGDDALKLDSDKKKTVLRRGKWTIEEEAYAHRLIVDFKDGLLPLADGTTLRTFLSKLLNCDPMRISKKFVGDNSVGKQVFKRRDDLRDPRINEMYERRKRELFELEQRFLCKVNNSKGSKGEETDEGISNIIPIDQIDTKFASAAAPYAPATHHHKESTSSSKKHPTKNMYETMPAWAFPNAHMNNVLDEISISRNHATLPVSTMLPADKTNFKHKLDADVTSNKRAKEDKSDPMKFPQQYAPPAISQLEPSMFPYMSFREQQLQLMQQALGVFTRKQEGVEIKPPSMNRPNYPPLSQPGPQRQQLAEPSPVTLDSSSKKGLAPNTLSRFSVENMATMEQLGFDKNSSSIENFMMLVETGVLPRPESNFALGLFDLENLNKSSTDISNLAPSDSIKNLITDLPSPPDE